MPRDVPGPHRSMAFVVTVTATGASGKVGFARRVAVTRTSSSAPVVCAARPAAGADGKHGGYDPRDRSGRFDVRFRLVGLRP